MTKIIKFSFAWCAKCKMLDMIISNIAADYAGDETVTFIDCDIDRFPDMAKKYGITSVPVIVIEYDGREVDRIDGLVPERNLRRVVAAWAKEGGKR